MIAKKIGIIIASILLSSSLVGCQSNETVLQDESKSNEVQSQKIEDKESIVEKPEIEQETDKITADFTSTGDLKVYFLDVGQGDSIYIKTPKGDDILIDGGNNDKGDEVVSYLKEYGVDDIEVMIATHPDADHIGGLDVVLDAMKVESVYMPKITHTTKTFEDFVVAIQNEGLKFKEAKAGVNLDLQGISAEFLAPVTSYGDDLNTSSAVLKIVYGENSFLFTGDATIESESDMISSGADLQVDVLKLGHHGANTSTSEAFLSKVKPKYAVISAGVDNQYGHPTKEILNRMTQYGISVKRTDTDGTVLAISNGKDITFKNETSLLSKVDTDLKVTADPTKPVPNQTGQTNNPKVSQGTLKASIDNPRPGQNETITLTVKGAKALPYTAVFHYKSKDTIYEGMVGTPLPIKIGRASAGFEIIIDITVQENGHEVQTQTSFIPQ